MKKYFVVLAIITTLLSSCSGYKNIDLRDFSIKKFKLVSTSKINLDIAADIDNPSKASFTITDIIGTVYKDDIPFAEVNLVEDVYVPARFEGDITIKSQIQLLDPLAVLVMGLKIDSWNPKEFKMKLRISVKKGMIKKTFKMNDIPLERIIKRIKL